MRNKSGLKGAEYQGYRALLKKWYAMIDRCYNSGSAKYPRYGGRGITICAEWRDDFQAFYRWSIANGFEPGLTLDRENNDLGYSPDNCRWASRIQQANNRSNNHMLTYDGRSQSITDWARETGIKVGIIEQRINKLKWSAERALTTETITQRAT